MKKEKIANTEKITQELDAMSERINAIKAEINKPEKVAPKEGEWWTFEGINNTPKCAVKCSSFDGKTIFYSEGYFEFDHSNNTRKEIHYAENCRPATTDEITHFMGLHADRLGMKEGVKVDRSKLIHPKGSGEIVQLEYSSKNYNPNTKWFEWTGVCVRDSQGNWAEVVKDDKVVVNGVEMEYGINTVRWTYGLTYSKQGIQALYDLTKSPELKTILDGFNKQK